MNFQTKNISIMNTRKLKIGVEEAKTARPCCRGLIIAHFEEALVKQQVTEILTVLSSSYGGKIIIIIQTLVILFDITNIVIFF